MNIQIKYNYFYITVAFNHTNISILYNTMFNMIHIKRFKLKQKKDYNASL